MNGAIDDDEAQAIAMVHFRKATLIIDEKRDAVMPLRITQV
jgi:hypothetical protein